MILNQKFMEQDLNQNLPPIEPQSSNKFPTWAVVLLSVIVTAMVVGLATYSFVKKDKEVANSNVPVQNNNTASTSPNNTASSVVNDLNTDFTQQGYKINNSANSFESTGGGTTHVWWTATDRLAVNITPASGFSFDITKSAPDDYSVENMTTNSDIAKVVNTINNYMSAHKIDLQSNQSSNSNPKIQSFTYTNAYYDSKNQIRCRVEILNPDAGVGEVPPFRFTASFACADANQYQAAYNNQLPFFAALTKYLSSTSAALYMLNPDYAKTCKNDPEIKTLEIYGIGESSVNYLYVKKVNNVWVDSGMSGYQAGIHCGSIN